MEEEKKEEHDANNIHSLNVESANPNQFVQQEPAKDKEQLANPYNPYGKKVEQHFSKAFFTVIGGSLLMFFMGSNYILGNISPYITSYFGLPD